MLTSDYAACTPPENGDRHAGRHTSAQIQCPERTPVPILRWLFRLSHPPTPDSLQNWGHTVILSSDLPFPLRMPRCFSVPLHIPTRQHPRWLPSFTLVRDGRLFTRPRAAERSGWVCFSTGHVCQSPRERLRKHLQKWNSLARDKNMFKAFKKAFILLLILLTNS